ncbi:uncharacterized protein OCT59_023908 [Rhizophagus irregularis]|uniref:uncharacterized protein n=1 Tax=Rhizophagus irregularis TaxID=588596 RepID=UPI00332FCCD6|nr:hypothetical protein OCT59_023908 [Rhizophagus irregularis]
MSEQRFRNHIMIMTKESEQPGEIINERIINGGRENLSQTNMSKNFVVNEELISVTEGKQKDFVAGFMELMQLESSYQTNVRKRKASEAFNDEFDYLYEIVTTGEILLRFFYVHKNFANSDGWMPYILATDWHFLTERIYCTKADYHIALTKVIWKTMGNFVEMLRYRIITSRDSLRKKGL